jgi:hypothetical protein
VRGLGPSGAGLTLCWVRRDLDSRASLARGFEQRVTVPCVRERVSCCEATNACADNCGVEAEGGAASAVEGEGDTSRGMCVTSSWGEGPKNEAMRQER